VGDNIRAVRDFPDVFPEELSRTAPISKRPYMMFVGVLKELKKQLTELQEARYIRPSLHLGEHRFCLYRRNMDCKRCTWIIGSLMMLP
jgi:hypothetical protein